MRRPDPVKWRVFLVGVLLVIASPVMAKQLSSLAGGITFDHARHATREGERCVVCHHTSTGTDVRETCRQCHRPDSKRIPDSRHAFHGSCIGCHEKQQRQKLPAGPTKRCSGCHQNKGARHADPEVISPTPVS